MRKWCSAILIILIVLPIVLVGGSFFMINYSLVRPFRAQQSFTERLKNIVGENPEIRPWVDSLLTHHLIHDTLLTMVSGERHHGVYVYARHRTGKTAILLHGYHDQAACMMPIAHIYAQMGYNVLLPDLHAHSESEGEMIQMGWKERYDVLQWISFADSVFSDSVGFSQQVVHGISMGAALTMCLSGEQTPPYVKCFVEDCGYTSVWDEFGDQLKAQFYLPAFPLLYTSSALCKLQEGWSFGEASPLKQVAKCHKPMLFIHGDQDTYVASRMVDPLYRAKPSPKQLWIAKGSAHAKNYQDHRMEYAKTVKTFVDRYIH